MKYVVIEMENGDVMKGELYPEIAPETVANFEKLVNEELLEIDGDRIKLTNKGLDLANIVWEEFV